MSLTAILFQFLAPFDGLVGYVIIAYLLFLLFYALVVLQDEDGTTVVDRLVAVVATSLAATLIGALVFVVSYVLIGGFRALLQPELLHAGHVRRRTARPA